MNGHICLVKKYSNSSAVQAPKGVDIIGYVFCNTGKSVVNIRQTGSIVQGFEQDQFTLEPGDFLDTRNPGSYDRGTYKLDFKLPPRIENDKVQVRGIGEITVTVYVKTI